MIKRCFSCLRKKPLLDDYYDNIQEGHLLYKKEIKSLTSMVEQSKVIIRDYELELDELRYTLANIKPVTIVEEITRCKRVTKCQHDTCDFEPMVSTIKKVRADCQSYSEQYSSIIDEHSPKIKKKDDQIRQLQYTLSSRNKEIDDKTAVITELNVYIEDNLNTINGLNNHMMLYKENYQRLLDENEFIKKDNTYLINVSTNQYRKNEINK
jgi:chromosome segregation ATPase